MIQQAIASPDPVLFLEPKARYWDKGEVDVDVPADTSPEAIATSLHSARVVRPGTTSRSSAYGPTVTTRARRRPRQRRRRGTASR